jgi:presenilin-like A22 family membrane protease
MAVNVAREGYELWRPNREKAESKTTRFIVAFVLLVSAALLLIIVLGGWKRLESPSVGVMTVAWAALYVLFAFLVIRWNRGVLPVAASLAIIMAIFAAIAAPAWFARNKPGLSPPALPDDLLGLLCLIVIPAQILLIAVAMVGFNQEWHVEEERLIGSSEDYGAGAPPENGAPAPA